MNDRVVRRKASAEKPRLREQGLVVHELPEELLVYDLARHKAHCLSPLAAAIWRACDGRTTAEEIAVRLAATGAGRLEADIVRLTPARLARARLLEGERAGRPRVPPSSRRDLLRKAAAMGGLAVLSLSAPTPALAISCLPVGSCVDKQCTSGPRVCCTGNCRQQGQQCGPGQGFTYVCL